MEEKNTTLDKVGSWISNSVMLKLALITFLMLLMLIPTSMIQSIIYERELLNEQASLEVSSKWGHSQTINGPILTLPIIYEYRETEKKDNEENIKTYQKTEYFHILPNELKINGEVNPQLLKRGIYESVVYKSDLLLSGHFNLSTDEIQERVKQQNLKAIQWDKAFLTIGISDLRGIKEQLSLKWLKDDIHAQSGTKISQISKGVTAKLPDLSQIDAKKQNFQLRLDIQGSQNLSFVPLGDVTNVALKSNWESPSFDGSFLPDARKVTENGFEASWKVLQLNRNIPQYWQGNRTDQSMYEAAFGVTLISTVDDYKKSVRSAKYAVMTIALTFLMFFLVEIINKKKIHPFQYALVGLGLCLFYVLLVSISEHTNFNISYGISTFGIIAMIGLYSISVFKLKKLSALLSMTLTGIYAFLFVTLQLADYALLMGSLGLMVILGLTMYFTRNIDWYKLSISSHNEQDLEHQNG
ncbi:MAG: cell envelope integrity protein CreD [Bacteroidota bacterium]